jgi:hypothetical protein
MVRISGGSPVSPMARRAFITARARLASETFRPGHTVSSSSFFVTTRLPRSARQASRA